MQRRSIFIVEPVPRIERQELDVGSFREIGGLIDHQPAGFDSGFQCHVLTVAPEDSVQQGQALVEPGAIRLFWIKDKSLTDTDSLPPPDVLATAIADDLEAALEQFTKIAARLGAPRDVKAGV